MVVLRVLFCYTLARWVVLNCGALIVGAYACVSHQKMFFCVLYVLVARVSASEAAGKPVSGVYDMSHVVLTKMLM